MTIRIKGSGSYVPKKRVLSGLMDQKYDLGDGYLAEKTGVFSRFYCENESQIDMAVEASKQAMEDAGIEADDIDLVISGCGIPYQTLPSTAPLLQRKLGIADGEVAAFDVNSTCLSFLNAIDCASLMLNSGKGKTALVFSSEVASRALPWEDEPEIASLFGDGAAAVVLSVEDGNCSYNYHMQTFPSAYDSCQIAAGGTRFHFQNDQDDFVANTIFRMNGKELFKITAVNFSRFVDQTLDAVGWTKEDVDLVVPHQASPHALSHMVRLTDFDPSKIVNIAADYGNQIAASIPTAFDVARQQGRIERGMRLLFLGTSAGVSFGGMTLEM